MQTDLAGLLSELGGLFSWAPDGAVAAALLVLAAAFAAAVHAAVLALSRRWLAARLVFLRTLLDRTRGPTRLAVVIFALGAAVQAAPLAAAVRALLAHALLVAFIVLIGWISLVAIKLAADLYLRRFAAEAEDNLLARKHRTQVRILERSAEILAIIITAAAVLMTFDAVRQYGLSLFASAGIAGLIAGLAARPVLANLIAGLQIAVTQPIRLGDAVVVENEWGWVEEITATYVVIRAWDLRRLIVPLNYFIEKPFQNWTRESTALIGSVYLYVDYSVPVERVREKVKEIVSASTYWDGKVVNLQVTDIKENTIELRVIASASNASAAWDLRCELREKLIAFLQQEYPRALPRQRAEIAVSDAGGAAAVPTTPPAPGKPAER
jgi:small-conductance mechanosensitive channel